jgi:hypothetical protein
MQRVLAAVAAAAFVSPVQAANPHSPAECLQQLESAARATS